MRAQTQLRIPSCFYVVRLTVVLFFFFSLFLLKRACEKSRHYIVWMIMCLTFLCAFHSECDTCAVFSSFSVTHTYSECGPLSNKLLQMWHFHPRFDQNVKSAEMWARTTEIPIKQQKYKRRPKTHYKQMLVTNRKHTELYVVAALKRWIFHVKQQLLVMYWFWCWLIQMPCPVQIICNQRYIAVSSVALGLK